MSIACHTFLFFTQLKFHHFVLPGSAIKATEAFYLDFLRLLKGMQWFKLYYVVGWHTVFV